MTGPAHVQPSLAQRIAFRAQNPLVRAILRSPAHPLLSGRTLILGYTGRRTGTPVAIPVMYARDGDEVVIQVGWPANKTWWRNFTGEPQPVVLRLQGADVTGVARALERPGGGVEVRVRLSGRDGGEDAADA